MSNRLIFKVDWHDLAKLLGVKNPHDENEKLPAEIEFSMVNTFVDRYLKGVAKDEVVSKALARVREYITETVNNLIAEKKVTGSGYNQSTTYIVRHTVKSELDREARNLVTKVLAETVGHQEQQVKETETKIRAWVESKLEHIERVLQNKVRTIIGEQFEDRFNKKVEDYIEAEVERRLQEKLAPIRSVLLGDVIEKKDSEISVSG